MLKFITIFLCALSYQARAAEVMVVDTNGKSLPGAVVVWQNLAGESADKIGGENILANSSQLLSPANLDVNSRGFSPRLLAVKAGQELFLTSTDGKRHKIFVSQEKERLQVDLRQGSNSQKLKLEQPGVYAVRCDLHEHELAYLYVHDGVFAAVSDEQGKLELGPTLMSGASLKVWHPQLMAQDKIVEVVWSKGSNTPLKISLPIEKEVKAERYHNRFFSFSEAEE